VKFKLHVVVAAILLCLPARALAQRELHWDALTVTAHLDADGNLIVTEEQTIVFTGDWNGGERAFRVEPRQTLSLDGVSRWNDGAWQPMHENASLTSVDDYSLTNGKTLRWRSRLASDPPFNQTSIRYQLRYTLSGILLRNDDQLTLDHDFAFSDRTGTINRFELTLTLDSVWQPLTGFTGRYAATNLTPGKSFGLTLPLRYNGTGTPAIVDVTRPPATKVAVLALFGLTLLSLVRLFVSEKKKGRFIPVQTVGIDEAWLHEHIFKYPAEVISGAWDDSIGSAEVVTLLARMAVDRKLESRADVSGMTLRLLVDRGTLTGYERKLVDALFFDGRTTTSTVEIKERYGKTGLNLVEIIRRDLAAAIETTCPLARASSSDYIETWFLFLAGFGLAVAASITGGLPVPAIFVLAIGSLVLTAVASIAGWLFRKHMDRGLRSMLLAFVPPVLIAAGSAAFVWFFAGTIQAGPLVLAAIVALALTAVVGGIHSLRSRQRPEGIAFRKRLAAGRLYFKSQLQMPQPALRDAWYPWLLAFELEKDMDRWSVGHAASHVHRSSIDDASFVSSTGFSPSPSSSSSSSSWSGFGGGRSGGGGGGASWAAAAGGLAAGVASPSSSSSSDGGGSSSGGGSSGGGGGGGW
jgi:uncharacterized membrane protein YgcG